MKRVLIVEDETTIAIAVRDCFRGEGFDVDVVEDGCEAERRGLEGGYELIVLDLMLPGQHGFDVCLRLRSAGVQTPIIVLTVMHSEADKVRALDLGADDYVTKPFGPSELLARARAVLRRAQALALPEVFEHGELRIDFARMQATRAGRPIALTPTEFRILRCLAGHHGAVVPIKQLLEEVWGQIFVTDRVIYTHINNIRQKLGRRWRRPIIASVRRAGYRIAAPPVTGHVPTPRHS